MTSLRAAMVGKIEQLLTWLEDPAAAAELWPDERARLHGIADKLAKRQKPQHREIRERTLLRQERKRYAVNTMLESVDTHCTHPITKGLCWGVPGPKLVVHARYLCTLVAGLAERGVALPVEVAATRDQLLEDAATADSVMRLGGVL